MVISQKKQANLKSIEYIKDRQVPCRLYSDAPGDKFHKR